MKKFSTADLCDKYPEKINVLNPVGLKNFGGISSFYGQIVTVKCYENNPLVRETLSQNGTGKVLVVDGGGSKNCALMGDNIAELAIENKWNGIIIFGSIRDSAAISKLPIGVKALDVNPLKSGKAREGQINLKLKLCETEIIPDHFLYSDEDGIVTSAENFLTEV